MMWLIGFVTGLSLASIGWMLHEIRLIKQGGKLLREASEALRIATMLLNQETWKL